MELLTKELKATLPPLYRQDGSSDPIVHAKFFTPDAEWTWYVTEGSAEEDDFQFFGYVEGLESEWGYFLLSELERVRGPMQLPIETDRFFMPTRFSRLPVVR